jgi:hypothetical protein
VLLLGEHGVVGDADDDALCGNEARSRLEAGVEEEAASLGASACVSMFARR